MSEINMSEMKEEIMNIKDEKECYECFLLDAVRLATDEYYKYGARSTKKVNRLHQSLVEWLRRSCVKSSSRDESDESEWTFELEKIIPSCNTSGEKRCDIVALYRGEPSIVFPVKFVMSNYYQNKNNGWETLTGECTHLRWANKHLRIVPINIIFSKVPYLDKSAIVKKWEDITYEKSFKIIHSLKENGVAYDDICYIIDVEHKTGIGETYKAMPRFLGFNADTPYRDVPSHFWKI
jgi:hypothetical protein